MDSDDPEQSGEDARYKFLANLRHNDIFMKQGVKASNSHLFSWNAAFRWQDQFHHTCLYVLLYFCIKKGHIEHADQVFCAQEPLQAIDGGASSHIVKKQKFVNTLHKVTVDLASLDLLCTTRMISLVFEAETLDHGLC